MTLREFLAQHERVIPIFRKTGPKALGADAFTHAPDIQDALDSLPALMKAVDEVCAAHRSVIDGVTPKSDGWCADDKDEYDARFSRWHGASYALRELVGDRKRISVYCKVCHKTHSVWEDEVPCGTNAWIPE